MRPLPIIAFSVWRVVFNLMEIDLHSVVYSTLCCAASKCCILRPSLFSEWR